MASGLPRRGGGGGRGGAGTISQPMWGGEDFTLGGDPIHQHSTCTGIAARNITKAFGRTVCTV